MLSLSRLTLCACVLGPGAALADAEDKARSTFANDLALDSRGDGCPEDRVQMQKVGSQWYAKGCNREALCDTVRNRWVCRELTAGHVAATNKVLAMTDCDAGRVKAINRHEISVVETMYRMEACGAPWNCTVKVANDDQVVECHAIGPGPGSAASPAGPAPGGNITPSTGPVNNCLPPCRAGFACVGTQCLPVCNPPCPSNQVCLENRCVSLCNPPCPRGLVCSAQATCVAAAK